MPRGRWKYFAFTRACAPWCDVSERTMFRFVYIAVTIYLEVCVSYVPTVPMINVTLSVPVAC